MTHKLANCKVWMKQCHPPGQENPEQTSRKNSRIQDHFSIITCSMVNRKISQAPLLTSNCIFHFCYPSRSAPAGRIDVMSRAIETRSYKQALMGERPTFGTPAATPPFGLTLTVPPGLSHSLTNSPLTSPFKAPLQPPSMFLTPLMTAVVNGVPSATTSTCSSSAATLVTSKNPHINPLIFDKPGCSKENSSYPPSTVCTSPNKYPSPSKKRPAKAIDLDLALAMEEELEEEGNLPDEAQSTSGQTKNHLNARHFQYGMGFQSSGHPGIYQQFSGPGCNNPLSEDTEGDPCSEDSVGSNILSPGKCKLRILMGQFSKDFKGGENVTSVFKRAENVTSVVNPQDPSLCMLLNTARIYTWANNWANEVPGVDEVSPPPKRPGFCWIPVANYKREKIILLGLGPANPPDPSSGHKSSSQGASSQGTVVHHNYYGQLFPAPGLAVAQDRQTYTFESFCSMGIVFAHANDLTKAIPLFNNHLKALGSHSGSALS
ncbi:hypothetical protein DFH28DRAFT_929503 [Melampsora americana]|nr:hypothetical protein DFH28DRAFT_929503 [Melampsora americana]